MDQATTSTASANILHCALELSKKSWLLAIQFPDREQPSLYPIAGGDAERLMAKLTAARDHWAKASGALPMITLCYEVGYDAFWLARFLKVRMRRRQLARQPSASVISCRNSRALGQRSPPSFRVKSITANSPTSDRWEAFWTLAAHEGPSVPTNRGSPLGPFRASTAADRQLGGRSLPAPRRGSGTPN
jgi:hypothetical protein